MASIKRTTASGRSAAGVLADVAHELSVTLDWESQVRNVIGMLSEVMPAEVAALGVQLDG